MRQGVVKCLSVLLALLICSIFAPKTSGILVAPASSSISDSQRNAMDSVLGAGDILCGQAMAVSRSPDMRMDQILQKFDDLRASYMNFKTTLTPQQLSYAAAEIADLDSGLQIINELFTSNPQEAVTGQTLRDNMLVKMRALNDAVRAWCVKFRYDCSTRLQIW